MMKNKTLLAVSFFLFAYQIGFAQIPKKALTAYNSAKAFMDQNNPIAALPFIKNATELYPSYYQAFILGGDAFAKIQKNEDAVFCYKKAISLKPNNCKAYIAFGDYYKEVRHKTDSALIFYNKAVKYACDTSASLNFNIGYCYNDRGKFELALAPLKKAILLDTASKLAINEISYSYRKIQNYNEAITYFRSIQPLINNQLPLFYIGLYYIELKQKDNAENICKELEVKQPKFAISLRKKIDAMK